MREVWGYNLEEEMLLLNTALRTHRIIAFDTEFPGFVHPSPRDASEVQRYEALVSNVNELKLIQLGLVLFNEHGNIGGVWQINFCDFNVNCDLHVPESIQLLRKNGIDFEKNRKEGVDSDRFALIFNTVLSRCHEPKWVTFHGIYDVAYMSKMLLKKKIPLYYDEFAKMVGNALGGLLYDVKLMAECILGQQGSGGLEKLSKKLYVKRTGEAHQAGSDSLMTAQLFILLSQVDYIHIQNMFEGYLYGISLRFVSSVQLQRQQWYTSQKQRYMQRGCYWIPRQQYLVIRTFVSCVPSR